MNFKTKLSSTGQKEYVVDISLSSDKSATFKNSCDVIKEFFGCLLHQ